MWFGDLVTMTWWDDLWLNESFAEWASTLAAAEATQWASAWTTFANTDKTWAYRQDQLPSTHPIAAEINDLEDVEVNFDGITYAKGAAVLKQLAAWVGRDAFLEGLRAYFRTFAWGNTTLSDLLGKLEETSGRDLKAWSAEWLETAGVNTLRAEFETDDEGRFTSFAILQTAPEAWPTLRSHRLAIGLYERTEGGLVRRAPRRARRRGRDDRGAGPGGSASAGPRPGQRRGPHLRQDPPRRPVAARRCATRSARSPRRCPARCAGRRRGT